MEFRQRLESEAGASVAMHVRSEVSHGCRSPFTLCGHQHTHVSSGSGMCVSIDLTLYIT